ncbi:hypothetical protein HQ45_04750 [Porphyromonas crevioricanis]|uniref:Uncharacterized protein n=1 Tax=Porphyromonas crevioricanis TaxID=393921 RepID=A0AB34PHP2_9PORP|nr:hypothetical protein [Porphyromonas crevioricanis]KGN90114.1 hypothetical protein HQ45_04750 [Porphyromonas crevioricanis]KGN94868.1 hypothetical protein HQ38_04910 [Porphyromonas crevioricanis]
MSNQCSNNKNKVKQYVHLAKIDDKRNNANLHFAIFNSKKKNKNIYAQADKISSQSDLSELSPTLLKLNELHISDQNQGYKDSKANAQDACSYQPIAPQHSLYTFIKING